MTSSEQVGLRSRTRITPHEIRIRPGYELAIARSLGPSKYGDRVPRLSTFYGIAIYRYIRDHGVAHFHARHGDDETVIAIETGEVLAGRLPVGQSRLVAEWTSAHRSELLDAWNRTSAGELPGTIDPLP